MMSLAYAERPARAALAASLAVNVFLLGFTMVRQLPLPEWHASPAARPERPGLFSMRTLEPLLNALPAADAALLRDAFLARRDEILAARRGFQEAMEPLRAEIRRDPVDPDRLKDAMETARYKRQQFLPIVEQVLLRAVPEMSPQGRQVLSNFHVAN